MRSFLLKLYKFTLGLFLIFNLTYLSIDYYYNIMNRKPSGLFIWGDSQAKRGFDLNVLAKKMGKDVYTSANSGGGVYDFLVFCNQVPNNADVIVSVPKCAQVRRKENDYNRSGFSFNALIELYSAGYSFEEVISISLKNYRPKKNVYQMNHTYPSLDSMVINSPLEDFIDTYNEIPNYIYQKQQCYVKGLQLLMDKGCVINLIEFPFHPILRDVEVSSPVYVIAEKFKSHLLTLNEEMTIDTIILPQDKNCFADLSHLNGRGAKFVSERIKKDGKFTLYFVQ